MTCIRGYRIHVLGRGVFCSCTRSEALMMECSFNLEVFLIKVAFIFKAERTEKSRAFLPGDWRLYKFEIWKSDYRWLQIWRNSSFCFFLCKVMAERRQLLKSDIHSNSFIRRQKVSIPSDHYLCSTQQDCNFYIFGINNDKTFMSQIFTVLLPLGKKFNFFQSLRVWG